MLGHLVSADGIRIDHKRIKAILKISLPRSKKDVQSFIGKINFLRWFIPNFAETIKQITTMLKKDQEVKWTNEANNSFEKIKMALTEAPILPDSEGKRGKWIAKIMEYDVDIKPTKLVKGQGFAKLLDE